jgi:hypothetical protein
MIVEFAIYFFYLFKPVFLINSSAFFQLYSTLFMEINQGFDIKETFLEQTEETLKLKMTEFKIFLI